MKFFLPALCLLILAAPGAVRAQEGQQNPQDEIITDFGIDEYLAIPKYTLSLGVRSLSGAKTSFTGKGFVSTLHPNGDDITTPNITRVYHDGTVQADASPATFTYYNQDGLTTTTYTADHTTPAGFTNTWSFFDPRQLRSDGNIDFHSYTADISDSGTVHRNPPSGQGIELALTRDMGNLAKRLEWKLFAGAGLNDIKASMSQNLSATVTTLTDTYALDLGTFGTPSTPYVAPHYITVPRVTTDSVTGVTTPVLDPSGFQYIDYVDQTALIGNAPLPNGRTLTTSTGVVVDHRELKGAYFTFRFGPSLTFLITEKLKATVSVGVALIYAGTTYTVDQTYTPDSGDPIVAKVTEDESKLLTGYYFDATLQYDFTERAGIYAGIVYEGGGSYTETALLDDVYTGSKASYKSVVDLSRLQGFRMGMTFRF
jgi:hypothetical protein